MLDADGTVWSTGTNSYGELGDGTGNRREIVGKVRNSANNGNLQNIVQISSANNTSYAIDSEGRVWAWGLGNNGQLGNNNNTTTNRLPMQARDNIGNITNAVNIEAGINTVFIQRADGTVWGNGINSHGQFAVNNTTNTRMFTQMRSSDLNSNFENALTIGTTGNTVAVVDRAGRVYTAGLNNQGQLRR
jgi:alpha-tubulin suppressor-like RCC1 family protein